MRDGFSFCEMLRRKKPFHLAGMERSTFPGDLIVAHPNPGLVNPSQQTGDDGYQGKQDGSANDDGACELSLFRDARRFGVGVVFVLLVHLRSMTGRSAGSKALAEFWQIHQPEGPWH